jgi:hypothetical protein
MAQRRALKDSVKDPMAKKKSAVLHRKKQNPERRKLVFKVIFSLILGFAGGLITGRFTKL